MWQQRIFMAAGLMAAALLSYTAISSVIGLSTSEKPTPLGHFEIPAYSSLVECDAHFSHEILRIKNRMAAHNSPAELPTLHRYYRRLHRLVRQVGRRDGIAPQAQTEQLRSHVQQLHHEPVTDVTRARDTRCRAMAEMPIARKRQSQLIIGR